MFGIDSAELLIIALVALVVIGPKDLPRVMRAIGNFIGQARGMARHFRSGIDTMIREAELEDMEKKWKADNERIMREHPMVSTPAPPEPGVESIPSPETDWGKAAPDPSGSEPAGPVFPAGPPPPRPRARGAAPPITPAGGRPPPRESRS